MGSHFKKSTILFTPHFLLELKPSLQAEKLGQVFKGPQTQPLNTQGSTLMGPQECWSTQAHTTSLKALTKSDPR